MLNIDDIFNVSYIQDSVIHMKNGERKMMYEIVAIRNENKEYVFENLVIGSNAMLSFIFLKKHMYEGFLESYVTQLIDRNIDKQYIGALLEFITEFKKKEQEFSLYRLYCLVTISPFLPNEKTISSLFDTVSIEYMLLDGQEIQEFMNTFFL